MVIDIKFSILGMAYDNAVKDSDKSNFAVIIRLVRKQWEKVNVSMLSPVRSSEIFTIKGICEAHACSNLTWNLSSLFKLLYRCNLLVR